MSDQFGGLPQAPPPGPDYPVRHLGARPQSVTNAVRLMFVQVVISAVSLIVLFATKDELRKQIRKDTPNASDATVNGALAVAAVIGFVFLVLYALLATQVAKGKNWARIVTWVLAGIGILSGLVGLGQSAPALGHALGVVALLVEIAIVVFLALASSNRYFRPRY